MEAILNQVRNVLSNLFISFLVLWCLSLEQRILYPVPENVHYISIHFPRIPLLRATTTMNASSRRISWPTTITRMNQLPTLACTSASARPARPKEATGSHPP